MDENAKANQEQPEVVAPAAPPVAVTPAPENPVPAQAATEQELRAAEQKIEQQIDERMTGFERSMVRLTRYGLAVTILTGIIFAGQLYEMITGGTQTDKLVGYAKTQANSAGDQADAAQQFSDTADDINGRMSDAVDQLQAAAENAKTTIKAAERAMRLDQRAWVSVYQVDGVQTDGGNGRLILPVMVFHIRNTGKTPARRVSMNWATSIQAADKDIPTYQKVIKDPSFRQPPPKFSPVQGPSTSALGGIIGAEIKPDQGGELIPPGVDLTSTVGPARGYPAHMPNNTQLIAYTVGEITYFDIFDKQRTTAVCIVYTGEGPFHWCPTGNTMN